MPMQSVQIRLSDEQLQLIDRQVKAGRYPSRSEAIRDYLRKAQLWEAIEKLLTLGDGEGHSEEEIAARLVRTREKVYRQLIAPQRKKQTK